MRPGWKQLREVKFGEAKKVWIKANIKEKTTPNNDYFVLVALLTVSSFH